MEQTKKTLSQTALELVKKGFKELTPTTSYLKCNTILINKKANTFWFTTKETARHTEKVAKLNLQISI